MTKRLSQGVLQDISAIVDFNEQITGEAYVDDAVMDAAQRWHVVSGMRAAKVFWEEAQADPIWLTRNLMPHGRCLFSALAVRDILRFSGFPAAKIMQVGSYVSGREGPAPYYVVSGDPTAPQVKGKMNAHVIVALGDIIIDPTLIQARRFWNRLPYYGCFVWPTLPNDIVTLTDGTTAASRTVWRSSSGVNSWSVSYFDLPKRVEQTARRHMDGRDSRFKLRKAIVANAVRRLNDDTFA